MGSSLRQRLRRSPPDVVYTPIDVTSNPKTGNDIYRVSTSESPFFLDWGVTVGEIAHNLRSALDGLVYQLALLNAKTPARRTAFPILLASQHFKTVGRERIELLRPEHQALIERLQPYKRGCGGRKNPLYMLKEVNDADKHRLITPVAPLWGAGPIQGGWGDDFTPRFRPYKGRFHGRILEDGARFGEAPPGVHVESGISPLISFGEEVAAVKGLPVPSTLLRISEHVSEIIESFGPEFA